MESTFGVSRKRSPSAATKPSWRSVWRIRRAVARVRPVSAATMLIVITGRPSEKLPITASPRASDLTYSREASIDTFDKVTIHCLRSVCVRSLAHRTQRCGVSVDDAYTGFLDQDDA